MGCALAVDMQDGNVEKVTGFTCKRGKEYAYKEVTNPTRIVTSTVRVAGGILPVVSVKTERDVPKGRIGACMEDIRRVKAQAPVRIGDVLLEDIAGTGVRLVATKNVGSC